MSHQKRELERQQHELQETNLLAAIRGQMRPLLSASEGVELVFDDPPADLWLDTDQGKVAEVLRNLISNALKFTERGEVQASAYVVGNQALLRVKDTGIGIALKRASPGSSQSTAFETPCARRG
ncbi:MAG: ATP-binding protein [Myxococcales bacterium]